MGSRAGTDDVRVDAQSHAWVAVVHLGSCDRRVLAKLGS